MTLQQDLSTTQGRDLVLPLSESILAVQHYYGESLDRFDSKAEHLWLLFLAQEDAIDRDQLAGLLSFAVLDANQSIDECLATGWIHEDEQKRISLTEKANKLFASMQPTSQRANQRWRAGLGEGSDNQDDLALFLRMLQHAGRIAKDD